MINSKVWNVVEKTIAISVFLKQYSEP